MIFKNNLVFFSLCLLLFSLSAQGQIEGVHLSWNGHRDVNTSRTMSVTWMSSSNSNNTIYYGVDSNHLDRQITADGTYSNNLNSVVFKADFKKLTPNTTFYYQIGSPSQR